MNTIAIPKGVIVIDKYGHLAAEETKMTCWGEPVIITTYLNSIVSNNGIHFSQTIY
jgi:hypothetical protein